MHIVSRKAIRTFCEKHSDASNALEHWYRVAKRATWESFPEVKQSFNTVDFVAPRVVFDIGGNKWRIIANIAFKSEIVYITWIGTHAEYEAL